MKALLILNDPPYGSERTYNGLRLAIALQKGAPAAELTVFLMADAVGAAKRGQKVPTGYYNVAAMLERVIAAHGRVLLCGTCMDARGLAASDTIEGAARSSMSELARATADADRVLVF